MQFFNIQARLKVGGRRMYVPPEGKLIRDIESSWVLLEKAEHDRELALREELVRFVPQLLLLLLLLFFIFYFYFILFFNFIFIFLLLLLLAVQCYITLLHRGVTSRCSWLVCHMDVL